mmetsp:Transcript_70639/g.206803  ORF Transcript_70639/g.206803 Transcript_70639/m.206803 type:complete len:669 (-) Transcript_70639:143-2149(-)
MGACQIGQCLPGGQCLCPCAVGLIGGKQFFIVQRERADSADSREFSPGTPASVAQTFKSFFAGSLSRPLSQGSPISVMGRGNLRRLLNDDFGNSSPSARVGNILETWDVRGARRPITEFYKLDGSLGEGQYGVVQRWKLKSVSGFQGCSDSTYVAVKQIRWTSVWGGWIRHPKQEELLRNELKMLLVLDNPFIVKFREWFEQPCNGIFFVTELCSGPSLQDVLEEVCELPAEMRQARMPRLRRYFREITYAVSYIHGHNPPVVHRDLKPDNVLLKWPNDPNSVAKLIDFGLASLQESGGEGTEHQGTPVFMAPEQYLSVTADITQEMDIWALGVIFVWIVTALELGSLQHPMLPVDEGKDFEIQWINVYRAFREKRPWNRELFGGQPQAAYDLCDRILVYEPSQRMKATEILEQTWVKCGDPAAAAAAELLRQGHVITNIRTYSELSRFDKKVLSIMADSVYDKQVILLRRTFQALDVSKSGKLSWSDFVDGFRRLDIEFPEEIADDLFQEVDTEGSGEIAYHDWLAATIGSKILRSSSATQAAFQGLNLSDTGRISYSELEAAVGKDEAESIMQDKEIVDESGGIPYEGFLKLIAGVAERRVALVQPEAEALSGELNQGLVNLRQSCPVGALSPSMARVSTCRTTETRTPTRRTDRSQTYHPRVITA